jgi:hypothetical protein
MPLPWKIKSKTSTLSNARKANSKKWQSEIRQFFTCNRRCWACKSCSSCSLRCIKRSNAAAFFFLVVSSSKYAILHELNCDYGSYTRLCSVELLRTDWGRCSEAGLLYVHVTMTHGKRLSYPYSAVFADTVVPSRCHRTIIRWVHDGIAKASRSRVAFLRQSGSFLFPSYCLREVKNDRWHRWSHEVKTKMTRFEKMPSRWPYEGQNGHTKMYLRKVLRQFFGMPKILQPLTKLLPEPEKLHRRSYDALRCSHEWPDGFPIRAEFEHFLYRVFIWCQFRDSVTPA